MEILLIDDDNEFAKLLRIRLRNDGSLNHASSLASGIDVLLEKSNGIHVVILDLSLPDATGLEGLRTLVSLDSRVAIVVLTGMDEEDLALQAIKAGAQDYVVKGQAGLDNLSKTLKFAVERKHADLMLQESISRERSAVQKLALLEQKQEFVAILVHDLKNPILGAQRLLNFMNESRLDEEMQVKLRRKIIVSNQGLLEMIGNVLDRYRLESTDVPAVLEPMNVNELVRACVDQFAMLIQENDVQLECALDETLPPAIGSPAALHRVVFNLLSNAIKFTRSGTTVRIKTAMRDTVEISVSDAGGGMSEADLSSLFESQWRTPEGSSVGSGLGLFLSKKLMEMQNGDIRCDYSSTNGTQFTVSLLATQKAVSRRILVVDDEEAGRFILTRFLERLGLESDAVCSAKQAIESVEKQSYAAIFLDIMMPEVDGIECAHELRNDGYAGSIFAYTAAFNEQHPAVAGKLFSGFLAKPISFEQLESLLRKVPGILSAAN